MRNRSVIEIMILMFTFIIGFTIVGLSVLILIIEVKNPAADTGIMANTIMSLVSGILGALLGLIAGKSASATGQNELHTRPDGTPDALNQAPPEQT
jgi:hypothetical protein